MTNASSSDIFITSRSPSTVVIRFFICHFQSFHSSSGTSFQIGISLLLRVFVRRGNPCDRPPATGLGFAGEHEVRPCGESVAQVWPFAHAADLQVDLVDDLEHERLVVEPKCARTVVSRFVEGQENPASADEFPAEDTADQVGLFGPGWRAVGPALQISEQTAPAIGPRPMLAARMEDAAAVPVAPGELSFAAEVRVRYRLDGGD